MNNRARLQVYRDKHLHWENQDYIFSIKEFFKQQQLTGGVFEIVNFIFVRKNIYYLKY